MLSRTRSRVRIRAAVAVAMIGLLVAIAATVQASVSGPPPFSGSSPFNQWLPAQLTPAANQGNLASSGRTIAYSEYTPAVYTATSSDPAYTINLTGGYGSNPLDGRSVRIPRGAKPNPDSDGHMTLVQTDGTVVSLYQAASSPSGSSWNATSGGIANLSGNGANRSDSSGGRESGISQLAGLITPDDVRRGIAQGSKGDLGHALAVGYGTVHTSKFVSPAIKAGGNSSSSSALWMGQKIYLDPAVNVDALPYSGSAENIRFGKLVARTLQRWGAIVDTNTGSGLSFQLVNPKSWTAIGQSDPWPALIGASGGGYYGFTIRGIPADKIKALDPYAVGRTPSGTTDPAPPPSSTPTVPSASGTNTIANPSFEADTTGWGGWQSAVTRVSLAGAPQGAAVAKVAQAAGSSFTIDDAPDTIRSTATGVRYTARAQVRAASPSSVGKQVSIKLRERDGAGALIGESSASVTLTDAFQSVTVVGTTKGAKGTLDVRLSQASAVSGDAFYADAVSLVAG